MANLPASARLDPDASECARGLRFNGNRPYPAAPTAVTARKMQIQSPT